MMVTEKKLQKIMEILDQVHLMMIVSINHHKGLMNNPVHFAHLVEAHNKARSQVNIMRVCRNCLRRNVRGPLSTKRQAVLEAALIKSLVVNERSGARLRC